MPPVRSVTLSSNASIVTIVDSKGTFVLDGSTIPASNNTIAKVETFINSWATSNTTAYNVVAHVFSINPPVFTIWTSNLGISPSANWWV